MAGQEFEGGQLGGLIDRPSLRGVVETHRFYNF